MTNLQNTETTKKQLNLFEPFFDKELTCNNEYMTYIDCDTSSQHIVHSSAVTSKCKNTLASNNNKYLLSLRLKLKTTRTFHKSLKIHTKYQREDLIQKRQMFKDFKQKISA